MKTLCGIATLTTYPRLKTGTGNRATPSGSDPGSSVGHSRAESPARTCRSALALTGLHWVFDSAETGPGSPASFVAIWVPGGALVRASAAAPSGLSGEVVEDLAYPGRGDGEVAFLIKDLRSRAGDLLGDTACM